MNSDIDLHALKLTLPFYLSLILSLIIYFLLLLMPYVS